MKKLILLLAFSFVCPAFAQTVYKCQDSVTKVQLEFNDSKDAVAVTLKDSTDRRLNIRSVRFTKDLSNGPSESVVFFSASYGDYLYEMFVNQKVLVNNSNSFVVKFSILEAEVGIETNLSLNCLKK